MDTQRLPRRNISENVRKLYSALTAVLSNEDRAFLLQSLNQYQRERDIRQLVVTLNSVLDTPGKREVYSLLHQIIPHNDKELFHTLWLYDDADRRSRSAPRPNRNHRRIPSSSSLPENINKYASDSGIDLSSSTQFRSSPNPIKRVVLKRPSRGGFGFCIRGGAEHGIGLYVSSVDGLSVAENQGLLPGDHILLANHTNFDGLTHAQAVKIMQSSKRLHLVVQSVGRIPNTYFAETTCNWVDVRGRRASPPPGIDCSGRTLNTHGIHKSDLRLLGDDDERKVNLFVDGGSKLGLMIRGGAENGLGIYITGVDSNCVAEQAGLKAGDQILDVNGRSFLDITHKEAVKVLKSTKNMILTLKDVGRLPFTSVTHDKTRWIKSPVQSVPEVTLITEIDVHTPPCSKRPSSPPLSSRWRITGHRLGHEQDTKPSKFHHGIAGSQVLYRRGLPSQKNLFAEQARLLLNENELGTMTYYLDEYSKGNIKIGALVLALFDLFDTQDKRSLITEVRVSIAPKDIDKFDDLVLKKEREIMENYRFLRNNLSEDTQSIQSNASSVSSFSGKGSSSSGSLDPPADVAGSQPTSASWVPNVLPAEVKVINDGKVGYDVYEATLTFNDEEEEPLMEAEFQRLPTCLTITPASFDLPIDESTLMAQGGPTVQPLLDSSLESSRSETALPTKTNGKATPSANVGDNSRSEARAKHSPLFTERALGYSLVINTDSNAGINSSNSKSSSSFSGADPLKFPLSNRETNIEPKEKTIKSQLPINPFIFPSKYTDLRADVEGYASTIECVHLSTNGTLKIGQPTTLSSKVTANLPGCTGLSKPEVEQKYLPIEEGKKGFNRLSPENLILDQKYQNCENEKGFPQRKPKIGPQCVHVELTSPLVTCNGS